MPCKYIFLTLFYNIFPSEVQLLQFIALKNKQLIMSYNTAINTWSANLNVVSYGIKIEFLLRAPNNGALHWAWFHFPMHSLFRSWVHYLNIDLLPIKIAVCYPIKVALELRQASQGRTQLDGIYCRPWVNIEPIIVLYNLKGLNYMYILCLVHMQLLVHMWYIVWVDSVVKYVWYI